MRKVFYSLLLISGTLASCSVSEEPEYPNPDQNVIVYRQLKNARAGYNELLVIDMDRDDYADFAFTTALVAEQGATHLQFRIHPVYGNQTMVTHYAVTPVESNSEIGPDALFRKLDLEPIVVKTITDNSIRWSGSWNDGRQAYIGVCFFRMSELGYPKPEKFYGWIRVSFNKSLEKINVHDLAYCSIPNIGLRAGQKN